MGSLLFYFGLILRTPDNVRKLLLMPSAEMLDFQRMPEVYRFLSAEKARDWSDGKMSFP
jgi:hypothetical protein